MEFNANDVASLNIMEYSLCLDDHPAPNILNQQQKMTQNNADKNSKLPHKSTIHANQFRFDKNMNNFSSFYLTNDYDAHEQPHQPKREAKPSIDIINEDDDTEDDDDDEIFNLNGEYRTKSTSTNKKETTSSNFKEKNVVNIEKSASGSSLSKNNINNNSGGSISNSNINANANNVIELDTVKHKLSSIWNNVKYGKEISIYFEISIKIVCD